MKTKTLGVSTKCFYGVILVCVIGIMIGSFLDFRINERLANVTKIGSIFAAFGCYFSYCLYPAAGMCLYKGMKKKGLPSAGMLLLITGWFFAVYYTNSYSGDKVRDLFHYTAGESSPWLSVLSWMIIALLYVWPIVLCNKLLDENGRGQTDCCRGGDPGRGCSGRQRKPVAEAGCVKAKV